ncbi:MAG: CAP domain-containing protein [Acidobacteria bacterium]|nr:CAP domain-containing protein [Acidobacteriota bacterium]
MKKALNLFVVAPALLLLLYPLLAAPVYTQNAPIAGRGGRDDSNDERDRRHVPYMDDAGPRKTDRPLYEVEQLEQQCLEQINHQREARGIATLEFSSELLPLARYYSWRMAEEKFFSHTDPEGRTVKERVSESGIKWRILGENLAYSNGYINPVAASLHGWMDSPGHRKNILDASFNQTAIGVWISDNGTVYFTEIFMKR